MINAEEESPLSINALVHVAKCLKEYGCDIFLTQIDTPQHLGFDKQFKQVVKFEEDFAVKVQCASLYFGEGEEFLSPLRKFVTPGVGGYKADFWTDPERVISKTSNQGHSYYSANVASIQTQLTCFYYASLDNAELVCGMCLSQDRSVDFVILLQRDDLARELVEMVAPAEKRTGSVSVDGLCGLSCLKKACPLLQSPVEGYVTVTPSQHYIDAVARYRCNRDFTLVGNSNRTCQSDKTWSGSEPVCLSCSDVSIQDGNVHNGEVNRISREGDEITFSCNEGFQLRYPQRTTCTSGQWTQALPYCEEESCNKMDLQNSEWNIDVSIEEGNNADIIHLPGTVAIVTCNAFGFLDTPTRGGRKTCSFGEWQGFELLCERVRGIFKWPVVHYDHNNDRTENPQHGGIRQAICESGTHFIDGVVLHTSLCWNGQWDHEVPSCVSDPCPPLVNHPDNLAVTYSEESDGSHYPHSTLATFHCVEEGFVLENVNEEQRTCIRGEWRGPNTFPSCTIGALTTTPFAKSAWISSLRAQYWSRSAGTSVIFRPPTSGPRGLEVNSIRDPSEIMSKTHESGRSESLVCHHIEKFLPMLVESFGQHCQWRTQDKTEANRCSRPDIFPNIIAHVGVGEDTTAIGDRESFMRGETITFRCEDVRYQILDGPIHIQCIDGEWTERAPRCDTSQLQVGVDNTMLKTVSPDGTFIVHPIVSSIYINCHLRTGRIGNSATITTNSTTQPSQRAYITGKLKRLRLRNPTSGNDGTYTCETGSQRHSIRIKFQGKSSSFDFAPDPSVACSFSLCIHSVFYLQM
ncbi:putative sushi, von Willebrand factor type A [Apostichopus japonicus]|uniref:Putative sushi, von Willebrand factor type A n=1 Tax=Stichopus japonicus TaxID=307972 RepID=A0A2G8K1M6_STIJA|nr:putative sushi, von Willebrand factor type A [Apostichopus japonicus]